MKKGGKNMKQFQTATYTTTNSGFILLEKPSIQRLSLYVPEKPEDVFILEKALIREFEETFRK